MTIPNAEPAPTPPPRRDPGPVEVPPPPAAVVEAIAAQGVELEPADLERLHRFLTRLYEANQRFNLTAIRDPAQAWERHVLDALTLVGPLCSIEPEGERLRVLDLGSGGGVPGLVLAAVLPQVEFTLVEATGKKAAFLEETAAALGLANATVRAERAETLGHDPWLRATFDAVVARAVAPLPVVLECSIPFLRERGFLLAIKGAKAPQEIEASRLALHKLHAVVAQALPTPTGTIVVVEKLRTTPRVYPRPAGTPGQKPL
jgi:16S rRNA (guanine527-N7)-methyltransferase